MISDIYPAPGKENVFWTTKTTLPLSSSDQRYVLVTIVSGQTAELDPFLKPNQGMLKYVTCCLTPSCNTVYTGSHAYFKQLVIRVGG